jgi:26S proteasome regulatory subunit N6
VVEVSLLKVRATTCFSSLELSSDPTIRSHLAALYDTLLEQNLLRIVEPYSVVEIEYVAQMVGQARPAVEAKSVPISV